jgi:hypothetical protein
MVQAIMRHVPLPLPPALAVHTGAAFTATRCLPLCSTCGVGGEEGRRGGEERSEVKAEE